MEATKQVFYLQVSNDEKGVKEALKQLKKQQIDLEKALFCMEHTGIYCHVILQMLTQKKVSTWVEHATNIKKSMGLVRGKSDAIDALRIAQYAYRFQDKVQLFQAPKKVITTLQGHLRLRERLLRAKNSLKKPLAESKSFLDKDQQKLLEKNCNASLKALEKDLAQVDAAIQGLIKSDPELHQLFKIVSSVPGIGSVSACFMIVRSNAFEQIKEAKKFACYAGLAPFPYSSGSSVRGRTRVSYHANKEMKALLHMCAMAAIKVKGELQAYFQRKVAEGKNKMLVLNAVRNKLVQRVFACVRDGRLFEKNYAYSLA